MTILKPFTAGFFLILMLIHPPPAWPSHEAVNGLSLALLVARYVRESRVYEADINGDSTREVAVLVPGESTVLFFRTKKGYHPMEDRGVAISRDIIALDRLVRKGETGASIHLAAHRLESSLLSMKSRSPGEKRLRREMIAKIRQCASLSLRTGSPYIDFERRCSALLDSLPARLREAKVPEEEGKDFQEHLTSACSRGEVQLAFPAIYGMDVSRDKVRQGDRRTPEGEFLLCGKNAASEYHRFIEIGYPNVEDAERGLREKLIGKKEYDRIRAATEEGKAPPYDTALGGEVGIHGLPVSWNDATFHHDVTAAGNWSFGCIVVLNRDIDALWDKVQVGDRIYIYRKTGKSGDS